MTTPRGHVAMVLAAVPLIAGAAGCAAGSAGTPRTRLGSLPFPGIFSLYEAADPDDLGFHRSGNGDSNGGEPGERARGTLYTRHAGFIDLSHVRESIDWVKFMHDRVRSSLESMDRGDGAAAAGFAFDYCEATFEISVQRPAWWEELSESERVEMIDEIAARAAVRLSVVATTWHEVATWYGHQTVPGISERGSAFTWDDTTAHAVGAIVGGRAVRDAGAEWDRAVTIALDAELHALGVTGRDELEAAAASVHKRWWKDAVAIRRDLQTGLESDCKVPWLVPGGGVEPASLALPSLADVRGRDARGVVSVRLTPAPWLVRSLARTAGEDADDAAMLQGEAGVIEAVERVRLDMQERFGEGFDRP